MVVCKYVVLTDARFGIAATKVQSYNFFSTHQIIARKNPTILCRDLWFKNKHLFSMDRVKIGVYFVTGVYPGAR